MWRSALPQRLLCAVGLLVSLSRCGEDSAPSLSLPPLNGAFNVAGFAPSGRSTDPRLVRIQAAGLPLSPPEAPGTVLDGFAGGLSDEDLPAGVRAETLQLVSASADGSRRGLPLRNPHVLARPSASDSLTDFVPIEASFLSEDEQRARQDRFDILVEDLAVALPCAPSAGVEVLTPRTPAEAFVSARADGAELWLGLLATGTIAVARFDLSTREVELQGLTPPPAFELSRSQRFAVVQVGPLSNGRPTFVVIEGGGGFEEIALILRWDAVAGSWADDTPLVADAPVRTLRGLAEVEIEGQPQVCAFGTVANPLRDAGLWCRTETSTVWRTELVVPDGQAVVGVSGSAGRALAAVDRAGSIHLRDPTWRTVASAAINQGCRPACAPFDLVLEDSRRDRLLIAGTQSQLLATSLPVSSPPERKLAFEQASFSDERPGGRRAHAYTAAAIAPDGRWWVGTNEGQLFRASSDLNQAGRVCLPATISGRAVTTIVAGAEGELLLGIAGGLVALTRWDEG